MNRISKKTSEDTRPKRYRGKSLTTFLATFCIMSFFWLVFSGKFDFFHISLGLGSCLMVSAVSAGLLFQGTLSSGLFICWVRFMAYLPWLFNQIFMANLHLLYLSFHPRMLDMINPKIIQFNSRLKTDISRTTLANSITLTPGTITVYADVLGTFAVHCIDDQSGETLPGEMENKIAKVFDES